MSRVIVAGAASEVCRNGSATHGTWRGVLVDFPRGRRRRCGAIDSGLEERRAFSSMELYKVSEALMGKGKGGGAGVWGGERGGGVDARWDHEEVVIDVGGGQGNESSLLRLKHFWGVTAGVPVSLPIDLSRSIHSFLPLLCLNVGIVASALRFYYLATPLAVDSATRFKLSASTTPITPMPSSGDLFSHLSYHPQHPSSHLQRSWNSIVRRPMRRDMETFGPLKWWKIYDPFVLFMYTL
ncbi:hypothetical protein OF83DRAFT_1087767 [Amylostereum chailletii]|nr:hypothetical protein OF83DRAFT_1087767 [Amylostereum chailletii]